MRITVLTYLESEKGRSYDAVVGQVAKALRRGGHEVSILGVHGDVRRLVGGLARRKPDLVFNLLESFNKNPRADVAVAGLLELLGLRYTGGAPGELYLGQDKGLAKKVFAFEQILFPDFAVFSATAGLETGGKLRMPLFVKPLRNDASLGIDGHCLVRDASSLMKQVMAIQQKWHDSALAEEYIEGREFYVGILGNQEPVAFPPVECDFSGLPDSAPHVMGAKAKWAKRSAEYKGTKSVLADLHAELAARLKKVSLDAYRALRVRDYGRVDLRLAPTGEIYVIEVNPNCYLEQSSEFAMAAAAAGIEYRDLINKIAELAVERFDVQGR
jgi:D-alanine-D-alanine ligase